jgi:hypothetical protein
LGNLSANGQVFLSNSLGVIYGSGSKVNVDELMATTLGKEDVGLVSNLMIKTAISQNTGDGYSLRLFNSYFFEASSYRELPNLRVITF